jgi:hypothetical protein
MEAAPLHVAVDNKGRPAKLSQILRYTYSLAGSAMLVSEKLVSVRLTSKVLAATCVIDDKASPPI